MLGVHSLSPGPEANASQKVTLQCHDAESHPSLSLHLAQVFAGLSGQRPLEVECRANLNVPVQPGLEREHRQKGLALPPHNPVAFVKSLSLQTSISSLVGRE